MFKNKKMRNSEPMKKKWLSNAAKPSTNPRVSNQKNNPTRENQSSYHEVNKKIWR
jgi:hypothetical protein